MGLVEEGFRLLIIWNVFLELLSHSIIVGKLLTRWPGHVVHQEPVFRARAGLHKDNLGILPLQRTVMLHLVVIALNHVHIYQAQHIVIPSLHTLIGKIHNIIQVGMLGDARYQTEPVAFSGAHVIYVAILCQSFTNDGYALPLSFTPLSHAHSIHPYPYKCCLGMADPQVSPACTHCKPTVSYAAQGLTVLSVESLRNRSCP